MQCVRIGPTVPPGASAAVVGGYAVLFFFDHSDICTRLLKHRFQFSGVRCQENCFCLIGSIGSICLGRRIFIINIQTNQTNL